MSTAGSGKTPQGEDPPELAGDGGRARLVVLAAEVGGRWSTETAQFLSALAKAHALSVPQVLQGRVEAAWIRRWNAILACSAARAFSLSLLDQRPLPQVCKIPSHEMLRDDRFTGSTLQVVLLPSVVSGRALTALEVNGKARQAEGEAKVV